MASRRGEEPGRLALSRLCEAYWRPLYVFARSKGMGREAAEDLVQGFFAHFLERDYLSDLDPRKGRFRSYLLAAFLHFISNDRDRQRARKRGGRTVALPLEIDFADGERRFVVEPRATSDPRREYERQWALSVVERATLEVHRRYAAEGRESLFDRLSGFLPGGSDDAPYRQIAHELAMTEDAVKMAVSRLRKRFALVLREQIVATVTDPSEVEDEIRFLLASIVG